MTTITCTKSFRWDMGHRVMGHEGKCRSLHGHSYTAHITANAESLDGLGRVVDFSVIKNTVGVWIDLNWDHGFCLHQDDPLVSVFNDIDKADNHNHKLKLLPYNPTAENLARFLLTVIAPACLDGLDITVSSVRVEETPTCSATACLS